VIASLLQKESRLDKTGDYSTIWQFDHQGKQAHPEGFEPPTPDSEDQCSIR
jgi:hypothetical protein